MGLVEFFTIQETEKTNSVAYALFEELAHNIVSNFTNEKAGGKILLVILYWIKKAGIYEWRQG